MCSSSNSKTVYNADKRKVQKGYWLVKVFPIIAHSLAQDQLNFFLTKNFMYKSQWTLFTYLL